MNEGKKSGMINVSAAVEMSQTSNIKKRTPLLSLCVWT